MMHNKSWKCWERYIAGMFGTCRNPLSGRNNRCDDGSCRHGDILYPHALVEVKTRRRNAVISRALESRKIARDARLPFVHIEGRKGDRSVIAICVDKSMSEYLIRMIRKRLEGV